MAHLLPGSCVFIHEDMEANNSTSSGMAQVGVYDEETDDTQNYGCHR
jgi:hypothetical protein